MGLDADFLALLESKLLWSKNQGEDPFGNEKWSDPVTIQAYVGDKKSQLTSDDNNPDPNKIDTFYEDIITDYVGIEIKDKLIIDGETYYVASVSTGRDEHGAPMYHQVQTSSVQKG